MSSLFLCPANVGVQPEPGFPAIGWDDWFAFIIFLDFDQSKTNGGECRGREGGEVSEAIAIRHFHSSGHYAHSLVIRRTL
jgi:hypothetical protein